MLPAQHASMQPGEVRRELDNWRWQLGLAVIFLAAVFTHAPALGNQLALDDGFILANPALGSLRSLPEALTSPWWYNTTHLYRPLTLASFALERALWDGFSAVELHATNVILHGVVSVLVAVLITRWTPRLAALIGALLFAVAPVHTEAVASVVGRAELLSALSMVLLLLLVTADSAPTASRRWLALLLSAAALAAKEGGVVAPVLAFVAAYTCTVQRANASRWALSASFGTLMLLLARVNVLGTLAGEIPNPVFRLMPAHERVSVALLVLVRTARTLVLPIPPSVEYVPSIATLSHPPLLTVAGGALILCTVIVLMLRHLRQPTVRGLGVWIAAATLAPSSNLLFASGVVSSGRTLYSPAIGVAFIVAGALTAFRFGKRAILLRVALAASALIACVVTLNECRVWRSSDAVIAEMQRRHRNDYRSYMQLAYTSRDHGNNRESLEHFREAVARFPGDPEMLTDAATVALRMRDTATARAWLEHAVALSPSAARGRTRLVGILLAAGDTVGAKNLLQRGLDADSTQQLWADQLRDLQAKDSTP